MNISNLYVLQGRGPLILLEDFVTEQAKRFCYDSYADMRAEGYDLVSYLVLESYHNGYGKQHDGDSQGDACGRYDDGRARHVVLAAAAMHFARYEQFKIHALTL